MQKLLAWIELKLYRQVLLMVAISVLFIVAGWVGEALGMAGNLAGAAGSATRILWTMFGIFVFLKLLRKPAKDPHCNCGNPLTNDSNFCSVCGAKRVS